MFWRLLVAILSLVSILGLGGGGFAQAQAIGAVISISGAGELRSGGGRARLSEGTQVSVGDIVTMGDAGKAQLQFADGTRIVVGPGSRLVIDEILMQSGGKAQRFAVSAVGGTFRFISGNSAKSAYSITTPTATMGIRGTTFDFAVRPRQATHVVLFKGEVQVCRGNGSCATVRGRCALLTLSGSGNFSGKKSTEQKDDVLVADFPFVLDQEPLKREFRAPVGSCGDVSGRVAARAAPAKKAPSSALPDRSGGRDGTERSAPEREAPAPEPPAKEPPRR